MAKGVNMEAIIVIGIGIAIGIIGTIFSLFLLPLLAGRVVAVKADPNITAVNGAGDMLDLVVYGGIFGSVISSFGVIFIGLKMMKS